MSLCFADISQSMPVVANESDSCNETRQVKKEIPGGFSKAIKYQPNATQSKNSDTYSGSRLI